jgi:hypothetical protein
MYNAAWFVSFALAGILSGIIWKWKPIIAMIAFVLFVTWFILSIMYMSITPVEAGGGFSTDMQGYHFIGSMCGGLVWSTMFGVGKNIYTSMEKK